MLLKNESVSPGAQLAAPFVGTPDTAGSVSEHTLSLPNSKKTKLSIGRSYLSWESGLLLRSSSFMVRKASCPNENELLSHSIAPSLVS